MVVLFVVIYFDKSSCRVLNFLLWPYNHQNWTTIPLSAVDCGVLLIRDGDPTSWYLVSVSRPQQQFVFGNLKLNTKPPNTINFMEYKLDFRHKGPIIKPCILLAAREPRLFVGLGSESTNAIRIATRGSKQNAWKIYTACASTEASGKAVSSSGRMLGGLRWRD